MKLRFQVTIVGEAEKGSLNSQVHFTLQHGGVIRLLIDKSSQIGVPTGRKTKSVPTIATTPHPWPQLGLVGCKSCIVPWQHRPSSDMGLTPLLCGPEWTRVLPTRLLILWLSCSSASGVTITINAITASGLG